MNLQNILYFVQVEMAVDQAEIEREVRRKLQLRESNALAIEVRRKQMEQRRVEEEAWKRKMTEEAEREAKLEQVLAFFTRYVPTLRFYSLFFTLWPSRSARDHPIFFSSKMNSEFLKR